MTKPDYPAYISFTDAATLIVRRGLAGSMTPRGLRYMAISRNREKTPAAQRWPFGDEPGQESYLVAGKTRMMRTARLLEYLEKHPPKGRGPARAPGSSASTS
ncbi:hypothetical protein [Streptomyces sp. NBRC 110035]|uniref:hypothetical protein n=1 Tax=Streptomyces sp. NBRC 110035 TaxID=1547867 RepID=UPI0005A956F1|nr:hypothetical protein [Streptomyces sp. NBRC 110035]